jgi:hypothetical protein
MLSDYLFPVRLQSIAVRGGHAFRRRASGLSEYKNLHYRSAAPYVVLGLRLTVTDQGTPDDTVSGRHAEIKLPGPRPTR